MPRKSLIGAWLSRYYHDLCMANLSSYIARNNRSKAPPLRTLKKMATDVPVDKTPLMRKNLFRPMTTAPMQSSMKSKQRSEKSGRSGGSRSRRQGVGWFGNNDNRSSSRGSVESHKIKPISYRKPEKKQQNKQVERIRKSIRDTEKGPTPTSLEMLEGDLRCISHGQEGLGIAESPTRSFIRHALCGLPFQVNLLKI